MRKLFLLILVFVCSVAFRQEEVVKKGLKVVTRNAKILKTHYPWEYNEPSDWINIHYCPQDEILLVASDEGNRYASFYLTLQSLGYTVEVYGGNNGDSLVNKQVFTNDSQWNYQFPLGKGKPCSLGYTTYKVRFRANIPTNKLLTFEGKKHPSSSNTNESILLSNSNSSTLTFFGISGAVSIGETLTRFKYANLYKCEALTSLYYSFRSCPVLLGVTLPKTMDNLTNLEGAFFDCPLMQWLRLPKYLNNVTTIESMCENDINLTEVIMPIAMNKLSIVGKELNINGAFTNCTKIPKIQYPLSLPLATTFTFINYNCSLATYYRLPTNAPNVTAFNVGFKNNIELLSLTLPRVMNKNTTCDQLVQNCRKLKTLILPDSMILCTSLDNNAELWELDTISTCVWGSGKVNTYFTIRDLKTFKQPTLKVSKLTLRGASLATASALHTITIDWANSTYGGSAPQIDIRWNSLSATTIDAIFTALPVVVGKTINVAGNPGSATCTPTIASLKGWTVITL